MLTVGSQCGVVISTFAPSFNFAPRPAPLPANLILPNSSPKTSYTAPAGAPRATRGIGPSMEKHLEPPSIVGHAGWLLLTTVHCTYRAVLYGIGPVAKS